jgi:ferric-dicitrate binding protein FerR (iron transport regulator)
MTTGNYNDKLIIRFLTYEVDNLEKEQVVQWLDASEQNRKYFEELKRAWELVAANPEIGDLLKIDVDKKWERFASRLTRNETQTTTEGENLEVRPLYPEPGRRVLKMKWITRVAAAAVVISLIGLAFTHLYRPHAATEVVTSKESKNIPAVPSIKKISNVTGKDELVRLPDGSEVWLLGNSEISYPEPFTNKREITLIGKAFFKVAKDKTRPFTVLSGPVTTTALGTQFTVNFLETSNRLTVRLYEGSVVIHPVESGNKRFKKEVYLVPGQEFVYGNPVKVRSFTETATATKMRPNTTLAPEAPSLPKNTTQTWYMFNNQPLNEVFDQLSEMYHTPIVFEKEKLGRIYFIGKYNSSDSLETILKRIALLNNLVVSKKDNAFVISR